LRIFTTPEKSNGFSRGLNPRTGVPEGSMLTARPPKPSYLQVDKLNNQVDFLSRQLKLKEIGESGLKRRKIRVKQEERINNTTIVRRR
jgi:hypothetical protein